jgi:DNA-binding transcriptional LysR family regulator
MDLRQIRYFVSLYEEKSITKSARRLHVVQPAVSIQIRRIEVEYGTTLFERTSSGVYPNEAAEAIYPLCIEIIGKVERLHSMLRGMSNRLSGALAIGVPPSIAQSILADVLIGFRNEYPGVKLTIQEGYSAHLVDWLLQGELDLAILAEFEEDKRLQCERLATEELLVVTSVDTDMPEDGISGAELVNLKLVVPSSKNLIRILIDAEFSRHNLNLAPEMEVDSLSTVFAATRQPGWASILPASAAHNLDHDSRLKTTRLHSPTIRRRLIVASPLLKPPSEIGQRFIETLKQVISSSPSKK